jgi:hypothetical protein
MIRASRLAPFALAAGLAGLPAGAALAGSQSSNSSSNCSDGRCSHVESFVAEDDEGSRRGWRRIERWEGRGDRDRPAGDPVVLDLGRLVLPRLVVPGLVPRGRGGDDD